MNRRRFPSDMKKALVAALALTLGASIADAQMKPKPPATAKAPIVVSGAQRASAESFPRIGQADAYKLYQEGKAVFIDVRSNQQYQLGHIKGSLSIPGSQIMSRFKEVPVRKTIITYCACDAEQSSGRAAANLVAHGVKNVFALKGGWQEWKAKGYPAQAGPK